MFLTFKFNFGVDVLDWKMFKVLLANIGPFS
jgi:hypothetical protein